MNRWAAPSRERMASEREGSAAADEQSPRRGRLRITLVDARVTCGHDRHRDRGREAAHAGPMGSDTAASPAIKMRRSPSRHPAAPGSAGSAVALCVRTPRVRPCRPSVRWRDRPADAAAEHLARQRSFQLAADQALEFTRTELGLVAFFREMVDQRLIESERHA